MSFNTLVQLEMTESCFLQDALKKKGLKVTEHETPQAIKGDGREVRSQKAELVCHREENGKRADIGFAKQKDGRYLMISDAYSIPELRDPEWQKELMDFYVEAKQMKTIVAHNFRLRPNGRKVLANGDIQIKVARSVGLGIR